MRTALLMALAIAVTACGQTGSLYLPDDSVETPVEIRTQSDADKDKEEEEEKKATPPPGR
jgi:predicted small lipoprotein YifL